MLLQVKKTDKDVYKKKNSWPLRELQVVDGKDENKVFISFKPPLVNVVDEKALQFPKYVCR